VYLRFAREATPIVTTPDTPYTFGKANVIRFRAQAKRFVEAFETFLSTEYQDEGEDISIVACGPMVPEAMRAAWLLKAEYGLETRVVNVHTIKPLDTPALVAAAEETQLIVTVEEHQMGGFGNLVAGAILRNRKDHERALLMEMIGVEDRFGLSGKPWELVQTFGLTGENIAKRVINLFVKKCGHESTTAEVKTILSAVECSHCHSLVSIRDYLSGYPMPAVELCADCERRSRNGCAVCQLAWIRENANFRFRCRDCREIAVQC